MFETDRTVVRPWEPADVDRAFDTYSRWAVAQWLGATPRALESPAEAQAMIARWAERNAALDLGGIWAVERKDDGLVAGTVLLVPLPGGDGDYEVGWHLHPDSWGRGLASEAARGALALGFAGGLSEVLAVVRPDNTPSLAVCRRLGMEDRGLTTRYYDAELALFAIRATHFTHSRGTPR